MHDLTGTVVAIIDDAEEGRAAVAALAQQQFSAELRDGEDGRSQLNEEDENALSAAVQKHALAFGDEMRIVDRLDKALQNGRLVVSVDVNDDDDDAARVAVILEEHGGHDMWRLGEWSFNRIGPEGSGEG